MADSFKTIFSRFRIDAVNNHGNPRYEIGEDDILGQGRYGMVMKVKDHITSDANGRGFSLRAMKLLKPSDQDRKQMSEKDFFIEVEALSKLDHPNLPRIFDWGEAHYTNGLGVEDRVPYYVMEFIEGIDLQKKLDLNEKFTTTFFKELVIQTLSALKCSFENPHKIIHLDIKPDNILVVEKPEGLFRFVLTDFGKAKLITELIKEKKLYDTPGGAVYRYVHPTLRPHLRGNIITTKEFIDHGAEFDLYSIGRVYEDVYRRTSDYDNEIVGLNPWFYLINDLCHNKEEKFKEASLYQYKNASDALTVVNRIKDEKQINAFPLKYEYSVKGIELMRLAENETTPFPKNIQQYVDTPEFQKLRLLNQLGETDLVYPSATHTRFVHSVGTFFRCLFYISALQHHPLFNYLYDEEDIEDLYLTALLHDVGHYPYAHYFEEIVGLKKLKVKHEPISVKIFKNELSIKKATASSYSKVYLNGFRIKMIETLCSDQPSLGELLKSNGKIQRIENILQGIGKYRLLKDIISGPIDSDKLDYLVRDGKQTGVPYSKMIDLERFYYSLTIDTKNIPDIRLAIYAKGRSAVESIISARYNMFSEVYWHKSCRSATAMIKDALWYAQKNITQEEFEWAGMMLGDADFLLWLSEKIDDDNVAMDLLGGLKLGFKRSLYKRVRTYSKYWKEEPKQDRYNQIIKKLGSNFDLIHKYKKNLVKILNDVGKKQQNSNWVQIKHHHIIVDIPNLDQDKPRSIKIKYPPSVKGKLFYDLKEISSLSDSIYDSFSAATKKARILCKGEFYNQLISLNEKLDECISKSFVD